MYVALQYDICFEPPRQWVSICGGACCIEVPLTPLWATFFLPLWHRKDAQEQMTSNCFLGRKKKVMLLRISLQFKSCLVMGAANLQVQCPCHATRFICQFKARTSDAHPQEQK